MAQRILREEIGSLEGLNSDLSGRYIRLLVHLDPDAVLNQLDGLLGDCTLADLECFSNGRDGVVSALNMLAFRKDSFVPAATLLRRLAAAENRRWGNNARESFKRLYHLHLSGTEADPSLRLQVLDDGLGSDDLEEQQLCLSALEHMLHTSHFTRLGGYERIGSNPPLKDWRPQINEEVFGFYREALTRLHSIACSGSLRLSDQARAHIAENIRGLLSIAGIFDDLLKILRDLHSKTGFWPEAPIGVSKWLYFDRKKAPPDYAAKVRSLYDELLPDDPVELLAFYTRGWSVDLHDPDISYKDDNQLRDYGARKAKELVELIVQDESLVTRTLNLCSRRELNGIFPVAEAIAERHADPAALMSRALASVEGVPTEQIEDRFFAGLISGANSVSRESALVCLKLVVDSAEFEGRLSKMISAVEMEANILHLPIDLLKEGKVRPMELAPISYGRGLDHLSAGELSDFIKALMHHSPDGLWAALDVLHMYQHDRGSLAQEVAEWIKTILLSPSLFHSQAAGQMAGYQFEEGVKLLHKFGYLDDVLAARVTQQILYLATNGDHRVQLDLEHAGRSVLKLLIAEQPKAVWESICPILERDPDDGVSSYRLGRLLELEDRGVEGQALLANFPEDLYLPWLAESPEERLPIILGWIPLTQVDENQELQWNPNMERLVGEFARRQDDLLVIQHRFVPTTWAGSLADRIEPFLPLLEEWRNHSNSAVRRWARTAHEDLNRWIEEERRRDANQEVELGF